MSTDPGLLDLVYVGVIPGCMMLLAVLWRVLPRLLRDDLPRVETRAEAFRPPPRPFDGRVGPVLPQP